MWNTFIPVATSIPESRVIGTHTSYLFRCHHPLITQLKQKKLICHTQNWRNICSMYICIRYLTFHLELLHLYIHLLLCLQTSMGIYILRFCLDCHWLLGILDLKWKVVVIHFISPFLSFLVSWRLLNITYFRHQCLSGIVSNRRDVDFMWY